MNNKEQPKEQKKKLLDLLRKLCIIKEDETATIQIGINQGKILYVDKKAKII